MRGESARLIRASFARNPAGTRPTRKMAEKMEGGKGVGLGEERRGYSLVRFLF